ncbi:response regulator transcription factor [Microbacterium sp. NPDC096154]|uniref:response regulator transcription factor n=1 Tax=Microbacterium sp. NPDC096154 TaxID=3155549 RepID=UPI003326F8AC
MTSDAGLPAGSSGAVRVVLVDDEALIRAGLRMLLDAEPGIEVVGEASDGHDGVRLVTDTNPDVVIMDVRMPGVDGVEATRRLTSSDFAEAHGTPPGILILTTFSDDVAVRDAVRAGAAGFLLKSAAPSVLPEAVRALAKGEGWLDPAVTRALLQELASRSEPPTATPAEIEALTRREREVLLAMADGRTNAQIAQQLYLSEATVKSHVHRIFLKLGITDRAQAVSLAFRTGLARS